MGCGCGGGKKAATGTPAGGVPAVRPTMGDPVVAAASSRYEVRSSSGAVVRAGFTSLIAAEQYATRVNGTVVRV
jgi:hypothetical protein